MFDRVYSGRRVLVTGHTGFKGSWLVYWLSRLEAKVCGAALPMEEPAHYSLLRPPCKSVICDIRESANLARVFREFQPEIVFHLAARPIVRLSYKEPVETFEVNVMGTVNLLECCRKTPSVKSVVVVTTDKCYENPDTGVPFAESAPLGGHDPYSGSKAAAEIAVASFRRSFFEPEGRIFCATARAGNVIGGGDWAPDRLIPDMVRAAAQGRTAQLRNPDSIRPWQHVLEPLSGYLQLGAVLFQEKREFTGSWNFGPGPGDVLTVRQVASAMHEEWEQMRFEEKAEAAPLYEAPRLVLDCAKARRELGWRPVWSSAGAIERTARWYRSFYESGCLDTADDLDCYLRTAQEKGLSWTK